MNRTLAGAVCQQSRKMQSQSESKHGLKNDDIAPAALHQRFIASPQSFKLCCPCARQSVAKSGLFHSPKEVLLELHAIGKLTALSPFD